MKKLKRQPITITGNTFTGVHWDKEATEAVVITARALLNLTELFKSTNINIEALLKIPGKEA